eukprot:CAMPEP_0169169442 /NCGR_PEP_ID=MMETSP1015-20121227/61566_1 /TAXON_ID=342587 /ORGANISM="Karlodinium micrum, Strain CCMP2283" /LENGTH=115 /DNA_ID=CAMNT_0009242337 /DNA_START=196 /DNA_END=543 /DNA_ORIENTATION=+
MSSTRERESHEFEACLTSKHTQHHERSTDGEEERPRQRAFGCASSPVLKRSSAKQSQHFADATLLVLLIIVTVAIFSFADRCLQDFPIGSTKVKVAWVHAVDLRVWCNLVECVFL